MHKLAFEYHLKVCKQLHGLDYRILRYANVYGPRQNGKGEAGVVAIFAERLLRGEPGQVNARRVPGDGGSIRDYVYVSDVARANLEAAAGKVNQPMIQVGTGVGTSTPEIARQLGEALGVVPRIVDALPRSGDVERSVLESSDIEAVLRTPTPLRRGLEETVQWYRTGAAFPRPS